jgi:glycosyltransferase involved in cell wall biosynthesis
MTEASIQPILGQVAASCPEPSINNIVAIIPAYNEERFIGSVVLMSRRFANTVIVVDDGSIDATAEVAEAAGAKVLRHPDNRGKAQALNTAFQAARDYTPDVVVTLDADGQHRPEELATVIQPVVRGEADLVIGSRYLNRSCQVPRHRIWGHMFFNWLTKIASGVYASDSQSGYRAFSARAISCAKFHSHGFSAEIEMQFIAGQRELKVVEVPVTIRYTDKPKRPVIKQGLQVLNGALKLIGGYRPLVYFGLPGLFLLLSGLGWGLEAFDSIKITQQLNVGEAFVCVIFLVAGLILLSTGFTLHSVRKLLIDFFYQNHHI